LPNALQIRIDPQFAAAASTGAAGPRPDRSPSELFGDYCAGKGVDDARVRALFDELHDSLTSPADAVVGTGS
jgi:exonuclease SbcD